jgi:6-phospho-beta-glucosidase
MQARREDEYLGNRHGLIGQETTGIGGMAKALRTIPVILNVAEDIKKLSPQALLINFTNPSGLITEALTRYAPQVNSVGLCNATLTTKMEIIHRLNDHLGYEIPPSKAQIKVLGLNHLTWFYGFQVNDVDLWPLIMRLIVEEMRSSDEPEFDAETLHVLGMLPNSYLRYYYYTEQMLAKQKLWPPSRAEEVLEIEKNLLNLYQKKDQTDIPEVLMARGGAYYSTVATQLINAHYNDLDETHVVNVSHKGAVESWNKDWVLELPCQVSSSGITPLPADPLPLSCASLIEKIKAYEIMTVESAVRRSRSAAYQALLIHPLGPPAEKISEVLDDLFITNQDYLQDYA